MKSARSDKRNSNYDLPEQKVPSKRMGQGDFANMPSQPKMQLFSKNHGYRDSIINSYSCAVDETSNIYENHINPNRG